MFTAIKQYGFFQFGTVVPGLLIHGKPAPYPVLNERAIRAGAGIMFALGLFAFFHAFYLNDYLYLQIFVTIFFVDFFLKVLIGTRFSPISQIANFLVRKQSPEYVGAVQKRFAWSIGLVLSGTMLLLVFGFGIIGWPNLAICGLCLTFMFLESAVGVCVGCLIYGKLLHVGIIKPPAVRPACAGNVCAIDQ